ncbi:DUF6300 family protein [Salinispora arenicola]|uniref:DUF6300 family protein n=1 Tax=Salinispora arenicola TaxID=168697 RepID=UPI00036C7F2A|nr:DUF6300 family protein [Salinispora arenicola]
MNAPLPCHRCGTKLLLSTDRPHPRFVNAIYRRNLCPQCDVSDPAAAGILAFFAVHHHITNGNIKEFETLLHEWVDRTAEAPQVSPEAFAADVEAFKRGDLD